MHDLAEFSVAFDLDGVCADYTAGVRALGFNPDETLARQLNRSGTDNPIKRQMYDAIQGTNFYANLPVLEGAVALWNQCARARPIIITAAPKFGASEDDYYVNPYWLGAAYHKRWWVEHTFLPQCEEAGRRPRNFVERIAIADDRFVCTTSARKPQFMGRKVGPHQILIDDREQNVAAWATAGGIAIHHDHRAPDKTARALHHIEASPLEAVAGTVLEAYT